MENKDQPAFPSLDPHIDVPDTGLTKREYFAGLAMQGFCASGVLTESSIKDQLLKDGIDPEDENNIAMAFAIFSTACADALLAHLSIDK